MLINLSNHPSSKWSREQTDAAIRQFGSIADYPFPEIDPEAGIEEIQHLAGSIFIEILGSYEPGFSVHIMGEFTFCYCLISLCRSRGITCYASTTRREIAMNEKGEKISKFIFIKFRKYW